ncbi:helix-turn-helix domain-containing protein [Nonomuraea angiospora]|uniref:helix-turn-helix domain-containing protein n=1 Tax=Nonomuraea angiospora TaxID=46172 RepID=UPI00299FB806|nr:helix-turn-helix domain-containing protein [Nonomuraea angiospora]MDX3109702.1 helix-turn-helix domain-containing protein [Nonomuraea angiospora]
MSTSRGSRAPKPTGQPEPTAPASITITIELGTEASVEAATQLIQAWANGQLNLDDRWLRPLKVKAIGLRGQGLPNTRQIQAALVGADIARRRRALGLTQSELARRAGLTGAVVSQIERGLVSGTSRSAFAVRRALTELEPGR